MRASQERTEGALRWVVWGVAAALGGFFIWSGVVKLLDLGGFTEAVGNYQLVGRPWDAAVAYVLPWLEVISGVALLTPWRRGGAMWVGGMLIVFLGALSLAWGKGLNISCGCFATEGEVVNYPWKLAQNLVLLAVAWSLFLYWHLGLDRRGSTRS